MTDGDRLAPDSVTSTSDKVRRAVRRFDRVWREVDEPPLEQFLPDEAHPLHLPTLVRLIKRDQQWRFRTCRGQLLECYLRRWPVLGHSEESQRELLTSECLYRGTYVAAPTREELESRFPTIGGLVDLKAVSAHADAHRVRESLLGGERFFLIRQIGRGGMGVVYSALDRQRQAIVALKKLPPGHESSLYYFKREFRALSEIVHPNLVQLYDLVSDAREWFFTMELIEGVDFLTYVRSFLLEEAADIEGFAEHETESFVPWSTLDFDKLRDALRQLAEGIRALHHAGKLHRDIKPSNVWVRPDGTVVLLDFGLIAELLSTPGGPVALAQGDGESADAAQDDSHASHTDWAVKGTAKYMSPEQACGQPLSPAADWYAMGVMLYEALTGVAPFRGNKNNILESKRTTDAPQLPRLGAGIPSDIASLCRDLLARDPQRRPLGDQILVRLNAGSATNRETLPFVGRQDYLHNLHAFFEDMQAGQAVTVKIAGRSGVGKTRLVGRFLRQLIDQHQAVVLTGRCYERETVPYKALDSLIDSLTNHLLWLPHDECVALMPADVAALARVFPVLRTVEAVAAAAGDLVGIRDLQELRRRAVHALRELLTRLGNRAPLVLYIDDLQWGDTDSAAVIGEIMRPPNPCRLLLLVCYRSEHEGSSACLQALQQSQNVQHYHEMEVTPLSADESRQLARLLLGTTRDSDRVALIASDSGGSPYFISELARQVPAELAELADDSHKISLDEVLWYRARELAGEPRRLLETICVAGCPVRLGVAYEAAQVAPQNQQAVGILKSEHFVRTDGPNLEDDIEVYHDRIRESIVDRLADETLTALHAGLASALESDPQADPEAIAIHFYAGGHAEKAGRYYQVGADKAADALAFDRAARLYRMVLEANPNEDDLCAETHEKLARALANAGRSAEAAAEYHAAAERVPDSKRLQLEREAAYQYLISGHFDKGRQALGNVLDKVGIRLARSPHRALLSLLTQRLRLRLRGLNFRQRDDDEIAPRELQRLDVCWSASIGLAIIDVIRGSDFQTRCLLQALRAGEPLRITRALALESIFTAARGTHSVRRTKILLEGAEQIAARVRQPYADGVVRLARSGVAMLNGRYKLACELSTEAEEIFRHHCTGTAWELDTAHTYRLWSLIWRGEASEVGELGPALVEYAQQRGDLFAMTNLRTYTIPHLLLWADEPERARETVQEALRQWSQEGFYVQHMLAMVLMTEIALYQGNGREAWQFLQEQWPAYTASLLNRIQYGYIQLVYSRARSALLLAGEGSERGAMLRAAKQDAGRLDRERRRDARAMAATIRAGIAVIRDDQDGAVAQLSLAIENFSKMDMTLHAAAARRGLGCIVGGDEGRSLVEQADAVMRRKGIRSPMRLAAALVPVVPLAFDVDNECFR